MGVFEMKIEIVRPFGGYRAGQQFEWADGMARILVGRGLVKEVEVEVEAAAIAVRSETAAMTVQKRKFK
jgi:hypothetical protein